MLRASFCRRGPDGGPSATVPTSGRGWRLAHHWHRWPALINKHQQRLLWWEEQWMASLSSVAAWAATCCAKERGGHKGRPPAPLPPWNSSLSTSSLAQPEVGNQKSKQEARWLCSAGLQATGKEREGGSLLARQLCLCPHQACHLVRQQHLLRPKAGANAKYYKRNYYRTHVRVG